MFILTNKNFQILVTKVFDTKKEARFIAIKRLLLQKGNFRIIKVTKTLAN